MFIAVGTPPDEDGSADLRHVLAVAEEIGRHMAREMVVVTKSTVPVGTAAKVSDCRRPSRALPVSCRVESGVSQRGRRGRRFHEARPRRAGCRERLRAERDGGALRAVRAHRQADHLHGHSVGRDDEVRGERDARDAHLVHERDGESVRASRRECRPRAKGDWQRRSHRAVVSVSRTRLRRFVLSEGRQGAHAARRATRSAPADPRGGRGGERQAEAPHVSETRRTRCTRTFVARGWQCGDSRSSRRPTTCANRRR